MVIIKIKEYTKDLIPDVIDFENRLANKHKTVITTVFDNEYLYKKL